MSTAPEFVYLRQIGYTGSLADMRNAYYNDLISGKATPFADNPPPDVGELNLDPTLWNGAGPNIAPGSGTMALVYFTAKRTEAINTLTMYTASTAAAATPTLCRMGIYDVAANGDLTLNSATPNDTALWAAVNTAYPKALSTTFNKVAGRKYATASLIISGAAVPYFQGSFITAFAAIIAGLTPRRVGNLTGQTDLPASVSAGAVTDTFRWPGMRLS